MRVIVGYISLALAALAAVAPLRVQADAYGDLVRTRNAFLAAKSWHGSEVMPDGRTVIVDYVAPDRWRISPTPKITELLIGDTVYMSTNGKTTKLPIPGGMLQQTIAGFKNMPASADVKSSAKDRGTRMVGGQLVRVYTFTTKGVPATLYVGRSWLPVQNVVKTSQGNVTITYSRYNDPAIVIEP